MFVLDDPFSDHYPVNIPIFVENIQNFPKLSTQVHSEPLFHKFYRFCFLGPAFQLLYSLPDITHDLNSFIVYPPEHNYRNKTNRCCEVSYFLSSHSYNSASKLHSALKKNMRAASLRHASTESVELDKDIFLIHSFRKM